MDRYRSPSNAANSARSDETSVAANARGLTLAPPEIAEITGYRRSSDQVRELLARGFFRARVRAGKVILERAHYDAVCGGAKVASEPKVRLLVRRS